MKKITILMIVLLLCTVILPFGAMATDMLVPVGQAVGLHIGENKVIIAGFDSVIGIPAQKAGLRVGDQVTHIDGKTVASSEDIGNAMKKAGAIVEVRYLRDGKTRVAQVSPLNTDDGKKLGIYLKQGISGVGTVTWYDPESGRYGALGHGINTSGGQLVPIQEGALYKASVLSVVKGKAGDPGQLLGSMRDKVQIGNIIKNTPQGIFGQAAKGWEGTAVPVADKTEIKTGKATIRSTVCGDKVQEYSAEILKIYPTSRGGGRNLLIKITDPELLRITGGIVQGMSGSPIIQNGKLIGAVTHVLVNDPTTGYGIFIENMLDAAA